MSNTEDPMARRDVARLVGIVLLAALVSAPVQAAKMQGTLTGAIAGNEVDVTGTCSVGEQQFQFWSDGRDFPVNRDTDGDGMYLVVQILTMGEKTMSALRYGRQGETVYNGLFEYAERGERSLSVDTRMGRADMPAAFELRCGG